MSCYVGKATEGLENKGLSSVSIRTLLTVLNYRTSNDPPYVRFEINFLLPENIMMLTLFTSLKSLSLGMKLLELAYKLTLFLIGNDNCGETVN